VGTVIVTGDANSLAQDITVGDLDEGQRARLLEIANRCPVHRTLTSEVDIRTRLA
jgi:uncharacterized OsmC-like protein